MIRYASPRGARGVSLIEVLVAIVIFSLGLLGAALMQLKGSTFTKEATSRTMAVLQARSLADRMQSNPTALAEYATASSSGGIPTVQACSSGSPCTATQVADNDIAEWLNQIKAAAPQSASGTNFGQVKNNGDGTYTITVSWNGLLDLGSGSDVSESVLFVPAQLESSP